MAEMMKVYKCELCGNIAEILHAGAGDMSCCGQPMKLYEENTVDAAKEKHVPVVATIEGGYKVTVGEVAHPMEEQHWIDWIEVIVNGRVSRQTLKAGDAPEAVFQVEGGPIVARASCNLHGLWQSG